MTVGQRMFGLETEYAFSALGPDGARISQATRTGRFHAIGPPHFASPA